MDKAEKIKLDPNAPRSHNGCFLGLPIAENDAQTVVLCAPWAGAQAEYMGLGCWSESCRE